MTRALVTGAAGFVGRHFLTTLLDGGWRVHAFDVDPISVVDSRLTSGSAVWRADARDWFRMDQSVPGDYDLVIHAAAVVGGRRGIEETPLKVATSMAVDVELFRWALRARPLHVVYLSSSAVYPVRLQHGAPPIRLAEERVDLTHPDLPDQIYGWAKLTGEVLARHARDEGLNVHVVRPFSGYGEDQSSDYPFPALIGRVRRHANPLSVWGDGTQVRDWVHIDDVVDTVRSMIEHDVPGPLNVGTGIGTSFDELITLMCELDGRPTPPLRYLTDAPTGVAYRVADVDQLVKTHVPQVALEEGIRRALAHR